MWPRIHTFVHLFFLGATVTSLRLIAFQETCFVYYLLTTVKFYCCRASTSVCLLSLPVLGVPFFCASLCLFITSWMNESFIYIFDPLHSSYIHSISNATSFKLTDDRFFRDVCSITCLLTEKIHFGRAAAHTFFRPSFLRFISVPFFCASLCLFLSSMTDDKDSFLLITLTRIHNSSICSLWELPLPPFLMVSLSKTPPLLFFRSRSTLCFWPPSEFVHLFSQCYY